MSSASGPSSTLVQGGESLATDLHLPILSTQSKQFLRISRPLALPSPTETSDLLAISNRYGLLAAATSSSDNGLPTRIVLHPLQGLRDLMRQAAKGSEPVLEEPWRRISLPEGTHAKAVRFSQEEQCLLIGLSDGNLAVWQLGDLQAGKVSFGKEEEPLSFTRSGRFFY